MRLKRLEKKSEGASKNIRETAAELAKIKSEGKIRVEVQNSLKETGEKIDVLEKKLKRLANAGRGELYTKFTEGASELTRKFILFGGSLEEVQTGFSELAKSNPHLSERAEEAAKVAEQLSVARGEADGLGEAINDLDGMTATIEVNVTGLDALTGVQTAKLKADLKKNAEDFVKTKHEAIKEAFKNNKLDPVTARLFSDILGGVEQKKSKKKKTKSDAEKLTERFEKTLDRLAYKVTTFDFSNVDKQTVETARSIGIADDKIRQFIASIEGDGSAPAELQAIQASFQKIADTKFSSELAKLRDTNVVQFLSDLDRETVRTARSFGIAEEEVKKFIASAATGNIDVIPEKIARIRTELETLADNKRLEEFKDDYANVLGNTLNSLFDSLFDSGKSVDEIMMDAAKSIGKLVFQLLIVEPLVKSFRAALGGTSFLSSSLAAPSSPMLLSGIYHKGGDVGRPPKTRLDSAGSFINAPRLHGGLGSKEFTAILEQGERVVTGEQSKTEANVISNLSRLAGSNGSSNGPVNINIDVSGARGNGEIMQMVQQGVSAGIEQYDQQSFARHVGNTKRTRFKRPFG